MKKEVGLLLAEYNKIEDAKIVSTSSNGNFALATIKSDTIDLMLTDYSMPDMDGLVLVKKASVQQSLPNCNKPGWPWKKTRQCAVSSKGINRNSNDKYTASQVWGQRSEL